MQLASAENSVENTKIWIHRESEESIKRRPVSLKQYKRQSYITDDKNKICPIKKTYIET